MFNILVHIVLILNFKIYFEERIILADAIKVSLNQTCSNTYLYSSNISIQTKCLILCHLTTCSSLNFYLSNTSCEIYEIKERFIKSISDLNFKTTIRYPMRILTTEITSSIGDWKDWEYCPIGSFVIGFNIKVDNILMDKTGLNSIKLFCNDNLKTSILSFDGTNGNWGSDVFCANNKRMIGFKYKYQDPSITSLIFDDTGGNSIYFYCEDNTEIRPTIEGNSGIWGNIVKCSDNSVICGLRVQYQSNQGILDDIALNDVQFKCCYL